MTIRLLLADDHRSFLDALSVRLTAEADLTVVGVATSPNQALDLARLWTVDVALVDASLGAHDGLALVSELGTLPSPPLVIVLSCHEDGVTIGRALRAGASGYVSKVATARELVSAILAVTRGETWVSPRLLTEALRELLHPTPDAYDEQRRRLTKLSEREREVLACMAQGMNRAQIARHLLLANNTVRTHTRNMLSKLGVHSSLEAVALALEADFHDGPKTFVNR